MAEVAVTNQTTLAAGGGIQEVDPDGHVISVTKLEELTVKFVPAKKT